MQKETGLAAVSAAADEGVVAGPRVLRPRLSTTLDPENMAFITRTARECGKDKSVVVDQLLADGRRSWDLTAKQKKELGRELALLRQDQRRLVAQLDRVCRCVLLLLAERNLDAALRYADGPVGDGEAPTTFAEWSAKLDGIASALGEGE